MEELSLSKWTNERFKLQKAKEKEEEKKRRLAEVKAKKLAAQYEPTWEEVWVTGWTTHTGTVKKGIFQSKLTDLDRQRLYEVKEAIERGEIGTNVESMKKFSKSHALGLYKALKESRKLGIIEQMIKNKPSNYILVTKLTTLTEVLENLEKEDIIAIDTETTGVDYDKDYVVGMSLTLPKADKHYYIPVRHNVDDPQLKANIVFPSLKDAIESKQLIGHNIRFDYHMLAKEGIFLDNIKMDTMIAFCILNENEPSYALKNLATKYGDFFGFEDKSMTYEELFGKGGFQDTPLDIATVYAAKDTHLTYKLYEWIDKQLQERPSLHHVYYDIENPTIAVSLEMERNGFLIDMSFAKKYLSELETELLVYEEKLREKFGDINWDSNQQLAAFLYDELKLKEVNGRSVDKATLEKLSGEFDGIQILLDYRGLKKLVSTYIEPLPQKVYKDGRLRGNFNQTATATGRFASNNPNLQNLPAKARKLIVAPEGKVILGKDFSQIEPRMLAYLSGDKEFQRPYIEGTDLYSTLASKVFKKPISECGDGTKYRKMMKVGLLASMYGTSPFTLAQQLGISYEEAVQFLEDFLNTYPQARDYMQSLRDKADQLGYVETVHGRKRRFIGHPQVATKYKVCCRAIEDKLGYMPDNIWAEKGLTRDLKKHYWEVAKEYGRVSRQAVNSVIQGSAADVMKIAMVQVLDFLKSKGDDWKLLATIHDEILIEVPEDFTIDDIEELDRRMTVVDRFNFPVKTDTVVFKRWGDNEIPVKEYLINRDGK